MYSSAGLLLSKQKKEEQNGVPLFQLTGGERGWGEFMGL